MSSAPLPPPDPVTILCDTRRLGVYSLVFGPPGTTHEKHLFSGHEQGLIIEWSLLRNRPERSWTGHGDTVLWMEIVCVSISCYLFTQGRDGSVKIWTHNCGLWTSQVEVACASMLFCDSALSVTQERFVLATPSEQQSAVDLHDVSCATKESSRLSVSRIHSLQPASNKEFGMCMKINFTPSADDGSSLLLVGYESGLVALWDQDCGTLLNQLRLFEEPVMCLTAWCVTRNGQNVTKGCCGSTTTDLKTFSIEEKTLIEEKSVSVTNAGFSAAGCRQDGKLFVTGGWDNAGRVFSAKTLRPLVVLTYHQKSIGAVKFSHNNSLAMGCRAGYITVWDVYKNN